MSNIAETGTLVPRNTQAPLTLPGMLSTVEHCDQSRLPAIIDSPPFQINVSAASYEDNGILSFRAALCTIALWRT